MQAISDFHPWLMSAWIECSDSGSGLTFIEVHKHG